MILISYRTQIHVPKCFKWEISEGIVPRRMSLSIKPWHPNANDKFIHIKVKSSQPFVKTNLLAMMLVTCPSSLQLTMG